MFSYNSYASYSKFFVDCIFNFTINIIISKTTHCAQDLHALQHLYTLMILLL